MNKNKVSYNFGAKGWSIIGFEVIFLFFMTGMTADGLNIIVPSVAAFREMCIRDRYKTVDAILPPIFSEAIHLPLSNSRIAYGNFCSIYQRRGGILFCSDDSKNFVMSAALVTAQSLCLSEASSGECRP